MTEWFHKKKEFDPDILLIKKVALDIVTRANSGFDPSIIGRLSFYAGLPPSSINEFELTESQLGEGIIDIVVNNGKVKNVAFSLGSGVTSIFFMNKDAIPGNMIYKSRERSEIKDFDSLVSTIHTFIRLEPKDGEIIDINREALATRMMAHSK